VFPSNSGDQVWTTPAHRAWCDVYVVGRGITSQSDVAGALDEYNDAIAAAKAPLLP
jgi:hypothetical protein